MKESIQESNLVPEEQNKDLAKRPKEEVVLVRPTKPMSTKEVLEEMKKQAMRPLTLDEVQAFLKKGQADQIRSEGTDIVPEYNEINEEQNQLPEK